MGGLVDYSSSSSSSSKASDQSPRPPSKKRRKGDAPTAEPDPAGPGRPSQTERSDITKSDNVSRPDMSVKVDGTGSGMPPLPATFHDLYASTVRQSVTDDPALHHGRKRQVPHIAGQWPSHVYIEWHPSTLEHGKLTQLINAVKRDMANEVTVHDFLTSDLGAPLPLHISLSRPLSLSTADKDPYLDKVTGLLRESSVGNFHVHPVSLGWFKSPDSDRSFLVMRVSSRTSTDSDSVVRGANPELMTLLKKCNVAALSFEQPPLYQNAEAERVDEAFHVSIGWAHGLPGEDASFEPFKLFQRKGFESIPDWTIAVSGVKVKIGNVVHHVGLGSAFKDRKLFD